MARAWIIVAESSRAKIYSAFDPTMPLVEVDDLVHPQGRLHEGDLIADSPVRVPIIVVPVQDDLPLRRLAGEVTLFSESDRLVQPEIPNHCNSWNQILDNVRTVIHYDELASRIILAQKILDGSGHERSAVTCRHNT